MKHFLMEEYKTAFLQIFGESPILKVLDFLVVHEEFDYSMKDVAKFSKVGYATLKLFWKDLQKNKIIKQTRSVGKAKMFKLDIENPLVQKFKEFYWFITKQAVRRETAKVKVYA